MKKETENNQFLIENTQLSEVKPGAIVWENEPRLNKFSICRMWIRRLCSFVEKNNDGGVKSIYVGRFVKFSNTEESSRVTFIKNISQNDTLDDIKGIVNAVNGKIASVADLSCRIAIGMDMTLAEGVTSENILDAPLFCVASDDATMSGKLWVGPSVASKDFALIPLPANFKLNFVGNLEIENVFLEVILSGNGGSEYVLPIATTTVLGGFKPDGITIVVDRVSGVGIAIGGGEPQDPTLMFSGENIELTQFNIKYNKELCSVPAHESVKIFGEDAIFLQDKAFVVKDLITDEILMTTTALEGTINDYLLVNKVIFAIVDENTMARWDEGWTTYPLPDYAEIKFVCRKISNYYLYYNSFFVSAKDSAGNYKLLKANAYSTTIEDLNLNEEVVDVSVADDGAIYALTSSALFTSKNPSTGWTKIDDPDGLLKNANFIEIITRESNLIIVTTSDGNVLVFGKGELFRVYQGDVPIVAISDLFCLLGDDSILSFLYDISIYKVGLNVEAIAFDYDTLIAINQTAKYALEGDTEISCSLESGSNISQISEGGSSGGWSEKLERTMCTLFICLSRKNSKKGRA